METWDQELKHIVSRISAAQGSRHIFMMGQKKRIPDNDDAMEWIVRKRSHDEQLDDDVKFWNLDFEHVHQNLFVELFVSSVSRTTQQLTLRDLRNVPCSVTHLLRRFLQSGTLMDLTIENVTRNDGAPVTPSDVFQLLLDEHNSFGKFVLYEHTGITVKHVKNFVKSWIARVHPFRFTSGSIRSDMWSANDLLQLREELLNLAPPVQYARDDSPSRRHRIARRMVYKNGEVLMHVCIRGKTISFFCYK
ncbi:hypothetical protein QR680_011187 [Steinernema hermaphroditum]|uniref:F-box associated domain-containing protein n=1 Tax=Steinernema hermaphroditum TaxID=289476 RepID=A0AA39IRE1_9BILA|nr:hypothetical protein QR680_011187 [Steinernema hermaphroditum]